MDPRVGKNTAFGCKLTILSNVFSMFFPPCPHIKPVLFQPLPSASLGKKSGGIATKVHYFKELQVVLFTILQQWRRISA